MIDDPVVRLQAIADFELFARLVFNSFDSQHVNAPYKIVKCIAGTNTEIATTLTDQATYFRNRLVESKGLIETAAPIKILAVCADDIGLQEVPFLNNFAINNRHICDAIDSTKWRAHYDHQWRFWQIWDCDQRLGIQIQLDAQTIPPWDTGSPLRNFLKWGLSTRDTGFLHAGTLSDGNDGLLIVGRGGSGKSTTVLAGLKEGLLSTGDDYILATLFKQKVYAQPIFHTLKCDAEGLQRLNLAFKANFMKGDINWQSKYEFVFSDLLQAAPVEKMHITALCLPEITHSTITRLEPLSSRDAFLALAPTGIAQLPGDRAINFALCAHIVRELPCFRLRLGTDSSEIAACIRSFLKDKKKYADFSYYSNL